MKALKNIEIIVITKITMENMIDEKAQDIKEGLKIEAGWNKEFKTYEEKLAKAVKSASREELEIYIEGRYFHSDNGNYFEKP